MSFKGEIEARCPHGCEPFTTQVWSFIRGDQSPELRDAVLWRECNLILCDECQRPFFPDSPYVYFEPGAELLAFVFPESYRQREDFWRAKMREDFLAMKTRLRGDVSRIEEPLLSFGHDELAEILEREDYENEERDVMEHVARDLGLSWYRVSASFARRERVPRALPYAGPADSPPTRHSVVEGLKRILAVNDRLTAFGDYLARLQKDERQPLPPAAGTGQA